ncbi:hypothetical protein OYC64_020755 [Pagothenia borchgrevinki]|uniref:Multidrug and toxin extrusion protein 1 n=1 Tax=Pagothenia borchgrevinki TaxID=8213 RepID=A0ABD2FMH1_PAGBO
MEKLGSPDPADPPPGAGPVAGVSVGRSSGAEEDEAAVSSKLFRCACVRRWVPLVYREELYQVLRLTGPLLLSRILNFLLPFVNTIFCGHIGNAELAGYALASATINITTTATGYGLALACDTLISQTYGSKNLKRVGVILQKSTLILLLFTLPCWALLINSHNLLIILHQEEQVAKIAQIYVMAYLPAVPAMFMHMLQVAYLQNQREGGSVGKEESAVTGVDPGPAGQTFGSTGSPLNQSSPCGRVKSVDQQLLTAFLRLQIAFCCLDTSDGRSSISKHGEAGPLTVCRSGAPI